MKGTRLVCLCVVLVLALPVAGGAAGHEAVYHWVLVGAPEFTDNGGDDVSLALNTQGTPYLAYSHLGAGSVMRFDGSAWVLVGSHDFAAGNALPTPSPWRWTSRAPPMSPSGTAPSGHG
ncbi:MAG: hypothetical protein NT169_25335 [Chloroflexi bacterium]|nr:hypothetical protein [Chloroflexota bacterium]